MAENADEGDSTTVESADAPAAPRSHSRLLLALAGRAPLEGIARVGGHLLPSGLVEASRLDPALFTPSTKAEAGAHDENITVAQARDLLGAELTEQLERMTLAVYERARSLAGERGIVLADTKLEFGRSRTDGTLASWSTGTYRAPAARKAWANSLGPAPTSRTVRPRSSVCSRSSAIESSASSE